MFFLCHFLLYTLENPVKLSFIYWDAVFRLWFFLVSSFQRHINLPSLFNTKSRPLEWEKGYWLTQSRSLSEWSLQRYWRGFSLTWMSQSRTLSKNVIGTTQGPLLGFTIIQPLPHLSTKLSKLPHHENYVQNIFIYLIYQPLRSGRIWHKVNF